MANRPTQRKPPTSTFLKEDVFIKLRQICRGRVNPNTSTPAHWTRIATIRHTSPVKWQGSHFHFYARSASPRLEATIHAFKIESARMAFRSNVHFGLSFVWQPSQW
jgi:hypothetical protein